MKVRDFQNRSYNWPPVGYTVNLDDIRPRSQYHLECRRLLKELYPLNLVLEEVPIPSLNLFLDFFTPHNVTAYEVNGEQHTTYNSFFFNSKADFLRAKSNDSKKAEWCLMNNIRLLILDYKQMIEWKNIIFNS